MKDKNIHKVELLLDSKYDIELEEYWKFTEEDKDQLAEIIVKQIHQKVKDLNNLPYHISQIDDRRLEAEEDQEFERADILSRILKKTIEFYS